MGTVDTHMLKLNVNDMMLWGIANMWNGDREGAYAIHHGKCPVNDFGHPKQGQKKHTEEMVNIPNFFKSAFPCLYPYGRGGIEVP